MSQFAKKEEKVSFTIQDTDLMLKMLQSSQITGAEAKPMAIVLDKLMKLHQEIMNKSVGV